VRLALVAPRFPPKCDGVGDHAFRLTQALVDLEHDVLVLSEGEPIETAAFQTVRVGNSWSLAATRNAQQAIRTFNAEATIIEYTPFHFGGRSMAPIAMAGWAQMISMPLATFAHEAFYEHNTDAVRSRAKAALFAARDAMLFRASGAVFVANELKRRQIQDRLPQLVGKVHVVPIGSNIEPPASSVWQGHSGGRHRLAAFGTVMPRRRIELLISMLGELIAGGVDAELVVIGRIAFDDYANRCRAHAVALGISDRVIFTGAIEPVEVTSLLLESSVALQAAEEGLISSSGTLLAAFAHGVPVVGVTTCFDEPALVRALIPTLPDPVRMAVTVRAAIGDPAFRLHIGAAGRHLYENAFQWKYVAQKTLEQLGSGKKMRHAASF
jgi:glycosyltransferase involved in cell wall biosynthesis